MGVGRRCDRMRKISTGGISIIFRKQKTEVLVFSECSSALASLACLFRLQRMTNAYKKSFGAYLAWAMCELQMLRKALEFEDSSLMMITIP